MKTTQKEIHESILRRTSMMYFAFVALAVVIIIKIIWLQFVDNEQWELMYSEKSVTVRSNEPLRADILDAQGRVLATTIPAYDIYYDTQIIADTVFNKNIDSLAFRLSDYLKDETAKEYKDRITLARKKGDKHYSIASNLTREQYLMLKTFPIFRLGQFKGGIIAKNIGKRTYPFGGLARKTIGSLTENEISADIEGNKGLESSYNNILIGKAGREKSKRLTSRVFMPIIEEDNYEKVEGKSVITSLDVNIQDFAERTLRAQLIKSKADFGTVVVMEVKTGNIKAIVNLGINKQDSTYSENMNYAIDKPMNPGSTFKLPMLIAVLEEGKISINDTVNTKNGVLSINDFSITDEIKRGKISIKDAFTYSSNVGMATIVRETFTKKEKKLIERIYSMGLNGISGVDLEGEKHPKIKNPDEKKNWSKITLAQMAIGYEIDVTPMQILTFYNAIANDGIRVTPKIGIAYKNENGEQEEIVRQMNNELICNQKTVKQVQNALLSVVETGTAKDIRSPYYKIAGKTGTAKYYDEKTSSYFEEYRASFVGYFPADSPIYSCIVVINRPKGEYYGAQIAAPVFKAIADKLYAVYAEKKQEDLKKEQLLSKFLPYSKNGYKKETDYVFSYLGIKTQKNTGTSQWIQTTTGDKSISFSDYIISGKKVPKVIGMGAKDAMYVLENLGLDVILKGKGTVREQSLEAGNSFVSGDKISLILQ